MLWKISPEGILIYAAKLPDGTYLPPAATDDIAFCISNNLIQGINNEGAVVFSNMPMVPFGGMIACNDNRILVSEGNAVTVWDTAGERKILAGFPGEKIISQPYIDNHGFIYVVTDKSLHGIRVK